MGIAHIMLGVKIKRKGLVVKTPQQRVTKNKKYQNNVTAMKHN